MGTAAAQFPSGEPGPEIIKLYDAVGLRPDEAELVLSWEEPARDGSGAMITGARFDLGDGVTPLDVYFSHDGALLSNAAVRAMGIPAKPKTPAPSMANGHVASGGGKSLAAKSAPAPIAVKAVSLPAIDIAAVDARDAEDDLGAKGAYRIGVFQDLPSPIVIQGATASHGAWQSNADGSHTWAYAIDAEGAVSVQVELAGLHLPDGAAVWLINGEQPSEAYGPLDAAAIDSMDGWAPVVHGPRVVIQCVVPDGAPLSAVALTINRISHNFRSVQTSAEKMAGACNEDITCYPAYEDAGNGVALITFIAGGTLSCSGSLIADTIPGSEIPYFLTANHCIPTQAHANTLTFYWFYETPTCDGTPPSLASVPKTTGGADLLATSTLSAGTDFTLVQVRNAIPGGVHFNGWNSAAQGVDADTVCVHHPRGDFKRITFGDITLDPETCIGASNTAPANPSRYYQSTWHTGTTEGGSSGSPLFNASNQIIGQLWGGGASCSFPACPDYYGRFDKTFPAVVAYLNPDTDGDGLSDGEEISGTFGFTSNPNVVDSDGDGIDDFDEVMGVLGYQTNPSEADTDGDGVDDPTEYLFGTNPASASSVPVLSDLSVPRFEVR